MLLFWDYFAFFYITDVFLIRRTVVESCSCILEMHFSENTLYGIIVFYPWDANFLLYLCFVEDEIQTHKPGRLTQNLIQDRVS